MSEQRCEGLIELLREAYKRTSDIERRLLGLDDTSRIAYNLRYDLDHIKGLTMQWEEELDSAMARLPGPMAKRLKLVMSDFRQPFDPPPVTFYVPFNRNPLFQERPDDFAELEIRLRSSFGEHGQPVQLGLIGLSSIGKTQLAVEIAYRFQQQTRFPGGIYWMLATDGKAAWQARLTDLAAAIDYLPPDDDPDHPENITRRARYLARYLCHTSQALLILDNVDQPYQIPRFLSELAGETARCALLYTSHYQYTPPGAQTYQLGGLPLASAMRLMLSTTRLDILMGVVQGSKETEVLAARALCQWAAYSPLALTHLRVLLSRNPQLSLTSLLEQLQTQQAKLLAEKDDPDKARLFTTISLCWEQIRTAEARQLLLSLVCLPEAALIPLWLVGIVAGLGQPGESPTSLGAAVAELRELCLLDELKDERVCLHPLVWQFAGEKLAALPDDPVTWRQTGASRLVAALDQILAPALPSDLEKVLWWHDISHEAWYAQVLSKLGRTTSLSEAAALLAFDLVYALPPEQPPEATLKVWNLILELKPDNATAFYNRGIIYAQLKQYEQAIANYDQVIALNPDYIDAFANRGNAYTAMKQYKQAIADYYQVITLDPSCAIAYNNRGNAYAELKQYEWSIADYDQAIAIDPNYAIAYNNRGNAYKELKQYGRALFDYDQVLTLNPTYALAYLNRGLIYKALGKQAEARQDFERAKALGHSAAQQELDNLDN
jgi:tetratricopeptide (TPR) repeat protein